MENKEALEYLKNHNKYYEPVNREAFRIIEKSLEELEELKEIMGTPIQDIMKRLKRLEKQDKILEEMREHIEAIDYGEKCTYRYYVIIDGNRFDCCKETYDMWSRWLGNDK